MTTMLAYINEFSSWLLVHLKVKGSIGTKYPLFYWFGQLGARAKKNYTDRLMIHNNQSMHIMLSCLQLRIAGGEDVMDKGDACKGSRRKGGRGGEGSVACAMEHD
jgi:hypothetical protein